MMRETLRQFVFAFVRESLDDFCTSSIQTSCLLSSLLVPVSKFCLGLRGRARSKSCCRLKVRLLKTAIPCLLKEFAPRNVKSTRLSRCPSLSYPTLFCGIFCSSLCLSPSSLVSFSRLSFSISVSMSLSFSLPLSWSLTDCLWSYLTIDLVLLHALIVSQSLPLRMWASAKKSPPEMHWTNSTGDSAHQDIEHRCRSQALGQPHVPVSDQEVSKPWLTLNRNLKEQHEEL